MQSVELAQISATTESSSNELLTSESNFADHSIQLAQIAQTIETLAQINASPVVVTANGATGASVGAVAADANAAAVTDGLMDIAKQLMNMADSLPLIKSCMTDVKAGKYKVSDGAAIVGGLNDVATKMDPNTGSPVQIIVDPSKKLIES